MADIDIDQFIDEAKQAISNDHATADQMDILVSKTRELTAQRKKQLDELQALLSDIESKLK